jgi:hypothetical protein
VRPVHRAEHRELQHPGVDVGAELAGLDPVAGDPEHGVVVAPTAGGQVALLLGTVVGDPSHVLLHVEVQVGVVPVVGGGQRLDGADQPLGGRPLRLGGGLDLADVGLDGLLDQREVHLLLAGEVVVDVRPVGTQPGGDVADPGGLETLGTEHVGGREQDLLPALQPAGVALLARQLPAPGDGAGFALRGRHVRLGHLSPPSASINDVNVLVDSGARY